MSTFNPPSCPVDKLAQPCKFLDEMAKTAKGES